jgi:hypothetical protein
MKEQHKNIDGKLLDLSIVKQINYLEITLNYTDYVKEQKSKIQQIVLLVLAYFVYLYSYSEFKILVSLIFVAIFCYLVLSLYALVEKESIRLVKGFVIEITSHYWHGRISSQLIQLEYIHDVIINEALEFVSLFIARKVRLCLFLTSLFYRLFIF